jgi:hypothetical protein
VLRGPEVRSERTFANVEARLAQKKALLLAQRAA